MNLKEFREQEKTDRNLYWRLQDGERQVLLDEALEIIEKYEEHQEIKANSEILEEIKKEVDLADEVKKDIENRITKGVATYSERLKPFNGRIALQDAYEEILDLALYIKQEMVEREQRLTEVVRQHRIEFNRGYICAVSNMLRLWDEPTLVEDIYIQNFFNIQQLREMEVDEQDIQLLKPIINEIKRKNRINELKGDK